jgi:riboflavin synthase
VFTGIVTAVGRIGATRPADGGRELTIEAPYADLAVGESIAVDGACLTVTGHGPGWFRVHAVATTLERTRFGALAEGGRVNLERALRVGDRLGGHIVQGHVDGIGRVAAVRQEADARLVDVEVPEAVSAVTVPLGSITMDGVSLTVNALPAPGVVQVSLIPFTLQHTTLGERRVGDAVHLEGDTVGKYVSELVRKRQQ